jgi:small-conductance mechanosensitive channel
MHTITQLINRFSETIISPDFWMNILWILLKIVLILLIAKFVIRFAEKAITRVFNHRAIRMDERRTKTMTTLLINIMHYVVYFLVGMMILANLGVNITTLIAGAGVVGLAIGFGAQSLVKDVITGFFIIFEDQFGVGDNVMINTNVEIRGNVEEVGLRITKIRAYTGEIHILANSQIIQVTNYSKANSLAVLDISVAYEEDLDRVFRVLEEVGTQAFDELDTIVSKPQVLGVQMFGASEVVVRMTADCKPMEHYAVARELRRRVKEAFDREGIEIPYPKQVLMFNGKAQVAKGQEQLGM